VGSVEQIGQTRGVFRRTPERSHRWQESILVEALRLLQQTQRQELLSDLSAKRVRRHNDDQVPDLFGDQDCQHGLGLAGAGGQDNGGRRGVDAPMSLNCVDRSNLGAAHPGPDHFVIDDLLLP
jgi:hypothetical protein